MKRLTEKQEDGSAVLCKDVDPAQAAARLAAFEDMYEAILAEKERTEQKLD